MLCQNQKIHVASRPLMAYRGNSASWNLFSRFTRPVRSPESGLNIPLTLMPWSPDLKVCECDRQVV